MIETITLTKQGVLLGYVFGVSVIIFAFTFLTLISITYKNIRLNKYIIHKKLSQDYDEWVIEQRKKEILKRLE